MLLRTLLGSIVIHIFIVSALHFIKTPPKTQELEVVELQISDRPRADLNTPPQNKNKTRPEKKLGLRDLGFKPLLDSSVIPNSSSAVTPSREQALDWKQASAYFSDPFSDFDGMDSTKIRFIRALWRQIDNSIMESPYLSEYGHVGKVFFRFEVSEKGELIEKSFKASAPDRILKVIAARAIRKALKNENKELALPPEKMTIHAQFSWEDYEACRQQRGHHQNYLSFCKYGENKWKSFSASEKAKTYLNSLKYGLGAVEEIQKYNREQMRRESQFDPFQEYRRDPDYNLGG
ncbi:MAG: hypothetical protein AB7O96_02665 [Pseudobdellovibrionaceae bacterium]